SDECRWALIAEFILINRYRTSSTETASEDATSHADQRKQSVKIAMATHFFGSHRGGIETVAERLFLELAALEHDVVWIASDATTVPEPIGTGYGVGIPVLNFVENRLGVPFPIPTFAGLRQLRNEIRKVDLLILHDCLYLINIFAFLYARL